MLNFTVHTAKKGHIFKAEEMLKHLPGQAAKAVSRAQNRALVGLRAEVVKEVGNTYTVKATAVRASLSIRKSTPDHLEAVLRSTGAVIGLREFKHTPVLPGRTKAKGVRVQVRKDSGGKVLPGTFIAKMNSGHMGVFRSSRRVEQKPGEKARITWPIKEPQGPAVPSMIKKVTEETVLLQRAEDRFVRELDHEIGHRLLKGL